MAEAVRVGQIAERFPNGDSWVVSCQTAFGNGPALSRNSARAFSVRQSFDFPSGSHRRASKPFSAGRAHKAARLLTFTYHAMLLECAVKMKPVFDNLAATFYNNVVAAYDEYVAHRDSPAAGRDQHLRTALAATTALYHFREHLPDSLGAPVKKLEQTSSDFALMRGVTNASKHKRATRHQPLVAGAEDITEVTVIVLYSDDDGDYSYTQTNINVICTDSSIRWLDPAITRTLNFWGKVLKDAGVCGYDVRPEPEAPGCRYRPRDEASISLNLEVMRSLDFRQSMQLLRFDNTLGYAVPIDLTGADVQFRIYEPLRHIVDVKMTHPKHGEMRASIPLTDEENIAFHRIKSQAGHEAFMEQLFQAHRSEIEQKLREQLPFHI